MINKFINDVVAAVNGNIEFEKNILGLEKEFDFVYVSHVVSLPLVVRWTLATPPRALSVVAATSNNPAANRDFSPIICNVAWSLNSTNEISISDIVSFTGSPAAVAALVAKSRYKIKVRITP